ncbi:unnamed protein product [Echinostoma caproni]|uniref:Uncharacterized protein n=1 Tax=Echinostoma caproni TaxID=27848 RepID=A0A183AKX8_9TREM|nr:unnamed protein product [Echinostoma caproni]
MNCAAPCYCCQCPSLKEEEPYPDMLRRELFGEYGQSGSPENCCNPQCAVVIPPRGNKKRAREQILPRKSIKPIRAIHKAKHRKKTKRLKMFLLPKTGIRLNTPSHHHAEDDDGCSGDADGCGDNECCGGHNDSGSGIDSSDGGGIYKDYHDDNYNN